MSTIQEKKEAVLKLISEREKEGIGALEVNQICKEIDGYTEAIDILGRLEFLDKSITYSNYSYHLKDG